MDIVEIGKMNEDQARKYLENIRWPNGPVCPHCQSQEVTRLQGEAHRPGTIQCNNSDCRKQFTVTVGGVMESSHIPLVKWALAWHLLCSSKKGMSALQLQRNLGLGSYRSAWFMAHRIRHAMEGQPMQEKMSGVIEADESWVGGLPRVKGTKKHPAPSRKSPVFVLVERDGSAICKPVDSVTSARLRSELLTHVDTRSILMTDEFKQYIKVGREFSEHHRVRHKANEYARRLPGGLVAHVNSAESFFALMKRGHHGTYHSWSRKHLHRYCSEFSFRWCHRKSTDTERTEVAIQQAEGKRLLYKTSGSADA